MVWFFFDMNLPQLEIVAQSQRLITSKLNGFTLIELMIVVVIIAILVTIALPSYSNYIVQSKRTEAQAEMMALAQYMERQYNASFSYPTVGNIPSSLKSPSKIASHYTFSITSTSQDFSIQAVPTTRQKDSKCGTLGLNSQGVKTPSTSGCWK